MGRNKVFKASLCYMLSSFFLKGLGFITTPIFSRILTTEEFGIINNFNAWMSIVCIIATLSLSSSLVSARFDFREDLESFIKTNLLLGLIITTFFFALINVNIDFWTDLFVIEPKYIGIMFLTVAVNPAYDMFMKLERFKYKYIVVSVITMLVTLSNISLSLLFIWLFDDNLFARIIGGQLPMIIVGIILYLYFFIKGKAFKVKYLRYSISIAVPYMVHLLSGTLLNSADRTMITKICGPNDNALYSMAYNVALIVNVIWSSMNDAFSPWLGEKLNEKNYKRIKEYSYGYVDIFVMIVLGVMLIAPEVLWILGGERYVNAKYVIPPVMMGNVFVFVYSMYVNIEQFERKTIGMAICTVSCAILNIILNWLMIPKFGYIAAAYTTLIGYIGQFLSHYMIVKYMGLTKCYDSKFIFTTLGLCLLIAGLVLMLYDLEKVRYVVIAIYLVVMLVYLMINMQKIKDLAKGEIDVAKKSK